MHQLLDTPHGLGLEGHRNCQSACMATERIRRLDRSHPVVESRLHFHDYFKEELLETSRAQSVSTGLYLTTLLNSLRNPDGSLPDISELVEERGRRVKAA